jgi:hypothetical protein
MADNNEALERTGQKPPIRAYFANADDIVASIHSNPGGELQLGQYTGAWLNFPATRDAVQAMLKEIGVDGANHKSYFACVYKTDIQIFDERLPVGADIDELNFLAARVEAMTGQEQDVFATAMYAGRHCGSVAEIINVTENMKLFDVQPCYDIEQYAEFLKDLGRDEHGAAIARLENTNEEGLCALPSYIDRLEKYFDTEAYARDVVAAENGVFTDWGYLTESEGFAEIYKGVVPPQYRVFAYPEPEPKERPSALGRLAAAKDAVAKADAEKPPADRTEKSPGAEL